ncbi:isopeptide-forming domain-containing fimbrial protein [bacterium 210820-DFI.6.37]|nr:isopeptide-forming domain-containing fimbrial protein [bacterium 210820-DFI.6.37]
MKKGHETMKLRNKLFTMLLACIMLVAMAVPAFASAQTGDLIINGTTDGKTYDLYKVLDLTQSGDAYSYTVNSAFEKFSYNSMTDGQNLVDFIQKNKDDASVLSNLAKALTEYAIKSKIDPAKSVEATTSTATTNLDYGYYVMNPRGGSAASPGYATMFSMNTLSGKDTTINVKAVYPSVEKQIVDGQNFVSANSASIGDDVTFTLTSKVPDLTGYKWYKFVAKDTLSEGLTYKDLTSITVGGGDPLAETAYTVTKSEDGKTIRFILKDLVAAKYTEGAEIVIKYTATVNDKAAVGTVQGNSNAATIEYSNDPSYTQDYDKSEDDFGENEPKGKSGESKTKTYTTALTINKTDGKNALTGAAFRITGDGVKQVVTTGDVYVESEDGTYWNLKDGTYTTDDPATEGIDTSKYVDTSTKYKKETETTLNGTGGTTNVEAFVNSEGKLTFTGLGAGTYTISEIVVPDGYNKIADFDVKISFSQNATDNTYEFTAEATNNNTVTVGEDGTLSMDVVNQSGAVLPSTGGMGTTIFYILGGVLVVGAGVLLITRRRINAEK